MNPRIEELSEKIVATMAQRERAWELKEGAEKVVESRTRTYNQLLEDEQRLRHALNVALSEAAKARLAESERQPDIVLNVEPRRE